MRADRGSGGRAEDTAHAGAGRERREGAPGRSAESRPGTGARTDERCVGAQAVRWGVEVAIAGKTHFDRV